MVNVQRFLSEKGDLKNNQIGIFIEHVTGLFQLERVAATEIRDHEGKLGN